MTPTREPAQEPPIDDSLTHYMEKQALAVALEKARDAPERERIERLAGLRTVLMAERERFGAEARARRHARGEVYSPARVAAINSMGPTRDELDKNVKTLYLRQSNAAGVLRMHALTHFAHGLVAARLSVASLPADLVEAARAMADREEAFARAWEAAVGDPTLASELRRQRQEAMALFRTGSRPMYLVTMPPTDMDDETAAELGKLWARLDRLAESLQMPPLSNFIGFSEEGGDALVPASEILALVKILIGAIDDPERKFPSRKKASAVLGKVRDSLARVGDAEGRACFEMDI